MTKAQLAPSRTAAWRGPGRRGAPRGAAAAGGAEPSRAELHRAEPRRAEPRCAAGLIRCAACALWADRPRVPLAPSAPRPRSLGIQHQSDGNTNKRADEETGRILERERSHKCLFRNSIYSAAAVTSAQRLPDAPKPPSIPCVTVRASAWRYLRAALPLPWEELSAPQRLSPRPEVGRSPPSAPGIPAVPAGPVRCAAGAAGGSHFPNEKSFNLTLNQRVPLLQIFSCWIYAAHPSPVFPRKPMCPVLTELNLTIKTIKKLNLGSLSCSLLSFWYHHRHFN